MAAATSRSGDEQPVERCPRGSCDYQPTSNCFVPTSHVEAEPASALTGAVPFFIEATYLLPVVAAPASRIDVLTESSRVVCDCGAGEPKRPCDLGPRLAVRQELTDTLFRNVNRRHRFGARTYPTLALLGRAPIPTQDLSVIADRRPRHTKAMSDLVHIQTGVEKLGHSSANL